MKLSKREPARRQRLPSGDLAPKPSPFAYRARRSDQSFNVGRQNSADKPVQRQSQARSLLGRVGLWALLIAIIVSAANVLSLSSRARILPMISGQDRTFLRQESAYEAAANKLLSASVWNHNKLTINSDKLARELQTQFPELESVSVTVPLLSHRPLVYIEPASPALVLMARNGAFVVSSTGKALLQGDSAEALNQPGLPRLNDQSGLHVELNHQALPANDVAFIKEVAAQLKAKQIPVADLSLPPGSRELDVRLVGQPYVIKFNLMEQAREQAGAFIATLDKLKGDNVMPAHYVDVRVPGRVYYQ